MATPRRRHRLKLYLVFFSVHTVCNPYEPATPGKSRMSEAITIMHSLVGA